MATKLKSKGAKITAFFFAVLLLSYSILTTFNLLLHSDYMFSKSYFETNSFKSILSNMNSPIINYYINFKDFTKKTDAEKVTADDIVAQKKYDEGMKNQEINDINNQYSYQIDNAKMNNEKELYSSLLEERDNKLEEIKKRYTRTDEEYKKEVLKEKNDQFLQAKKDVEAIRIIKYYFKNTKTGEVYTNLTGITNIEQYIKNNALYYEKIPHAAKGYNEYLSDSLNNLFISNSLVGYYIVPNYDNNENPYYNDFRNFVTFRSSLLFQAIVAVITLILAGGLFAFSSVKNDVQIDKKENVITLYAKIPLEIRGFILMVWVTAYLAILVEMRDIINEYPTIPYLITYAFTFVFTAFLVINIRGIFKMLADLEYLKKQCKSIIAYRLWKIFAESILIKRVFLQVFIFGILSFLVGLCLPIGDGFGIFLFLVYLAVIPYLVLKKVGYLNKIIDGSKAIVDGNLDYTIEENGKDTLADLAHNINNMKLGYKKSLENQIKSDRMKTELITNVSHDLKTPLTSIINYVDLLKKGSLSQEEMDGYIGILERKASRLKILIEDLFEASKMSSGAVELNIEKVDVASLLKQSLAEFDEKISSSSLIYKVNVPEHKIYIQLDGKKTWRVFENLINNTLKYSQPNTRVYIDLKEEDNKVKLIIKNISNYEMSFNSEEIFERFVRGDKARHTEGSGLGLAIAKNIVELQGGRLMVDIDGDLFKATVEFNKYQN